MGEQKRRAAASGGHTGPAVEAAVGLTEEQLALPWQAILPLLEPVLAHAQKAAFDQGRSAFDYASIGVADGELSIILARSEEVVRAVADAQALRDIYTRVPGERTFPSEPGQGEYDVLTGAGASGKFGG